MRRSISTAVMVLVAGLSVPLFGSAAHAAVPARAVTASCSITTPRGDCYQAGEFCSRVELGESTTAADGEAIHCVLDGQYRRWLGTGSSSTPSGGTSGATTGSTTTGGTTPVVPLGGVAAGGGGLAMAAHQQAVAAPHDGTAMPAGLAVGALAAGIGGALVVRRRRAADGR